MAIATAMRVVDMIGELDRGSLVPRGGLWRSLLSVGAKFSYPVTVSTVTDHTARTLKKESRLFCAPRGRLLFSFLPRARGRPRRTGGMVHTVAPDAALDDCKVDGEVIPQLRFWPSQILQVFERARTLCLSATHHTGCWRSARSRFRPFLAAVVNGSKECGRFAPRLISQTILASKV